MEISGILYEHQDQAVDRRIIFKTKLWVRYNLKKRYNIKKKNEDFIIR